MKFHESKLAKPNFGHLWACLIMITLKKDIFSLHIIFNPPYPAARQGRQCQKWEMYSSTRELLKAIEILAPSKRNPSFACFPYGNYRFKWHCNPYECGPGATPLFYAGQICQGWVKTQKTGHNELHVKLSLKRFAFCYSKM